MQRREVMPTGIVAEQLDDPAVEHQAENQPAEEPDADQRIVGEEGQEADFEQQNIPLKRKKILANNAELKPKNQAPAEGSSRGGLPAS
jgi:hypothetical protein